MSRFPENTFTDLVRTFPGLAGHQEECLEIGPATPLYNCIAWAVGREDLWINPPTKRPAFDALFRFFGLDTCDEEEATVDAYVHAEDYSHASRKTEDYGWTSKLGCSYRIAHPRDGLANGSIYGDIVGHFQPRTMQEHIPAAEHKDPIEPLSPDESTSLADLVSRLCKSFPQSTTVYYKKCHVWSEYAPSRPVALAFSSASSDFAYGSDWEALVRMDTRILPLIVHQLAQGTALFGCELYNRLQTNAEAKVSPDQNEQFWVLNWQANNISKLYSAQVQTFMTHADQWKTDRRRAMFSSKADSFTSGAGYDSIKAMGKPVIPLIMDQYVQEKDGWWYELLFEILAGRKLGLVLINKMNLYEAWAQWFEDPGLDIPRLTEKSSSGERCITMTHSDPGRMPVTFSLAT